MYEGRFRLFVFVLNYLVLRIVLKLCARDLIGIQKGLLQIGFTLFFVFCKKRHRIRLYTRPLWVRFPISGRNYFHSLRSGKKTKHEVESANEHAKYQELGVASVCQEHL